MNGDTAMFSLIPKSSVKSLQYSSSEHLDFGSCQYILHVTKAMCSRVMRCNTDRSGVIVEKVPSRPLPLTENPRLLTLNISGMEANIQNNVSLMSCTVSRRFGVCEVENVPL